MFRQLIDYVKNPFQTIRKDSFANPFTGIGARNSRSETSRFIANFNINQTELTDIYVGNGLGKRIVSILVEDATRNFIKCNSNDLLDELKRLKFKQKLSDAAIFGRLYGGCLLVAFVDDGGNLYNPLNMDGIKQVVSFHCYDRYQVTWQQDDLVDDVYSTDYGTPEIYTIANYSGQTFRVHKSRCMLFSGDRLPNLEKQRNQGWDASVLQSVYSSIRDYSIGIGATSEIIQDFVQRVLKVDGLADKVLAQGGEKSVVGRLAYNDMMLSVSKTLLIDAEHEEYTKHSSNVSGLPELLDRFIEYISSTTGIPITKLSGRSPAGLNSTGDSDISNWNSLVEEYRIDKLSPAFEWCIEMLENQKIWKGKKPDSFDWSFPSLVTPDESEVAKINLTIAQTDQIYIDRGAFDAMEIAKLRYADGKFQTNISIEDIETEINDTDYEVDITEDLKTIEEKKILEEKARIDSAMATENSKKLDKFETLLKMVKNDF